MEKLSINTPQNVNIEYRLASVGTRFISSFLDYVIIIGYAIFINMIILPLFVDKSDLWLYFGTMSLFLLPAFFYHLALETFLGGQSIGKMVMKTKVVKIDGSRATIYEYFIRWTLSIVDIWLLGGVIGLVSIILTKKSQRIGDIAASTTVVSLKPKLQLIETVYEDIEHAYAPTYSQVMKLTDKDINIIKKSFNSALNNGDDHIIEALAKKAKQVMGISTIEESDTDFLKTVIQDHYHYFRGN